jgi:hypothetical protein
MEVGKYENTGLLLGRIAGVDAEFALGYEKYLKPLLYFVCR